MNQPQKDACDEFVYIPQYSGATASLNVAIAGSIVFHHFALWADYNEHGRTGEKFDVVQPRGKLEAWLNPTEEEKRELDLKRKARALAKAEAAAARDANRLEKERRARDHVFWVCAVGERRSNLGSLARAVAALSTVPCSILRASSTPITNGGWAPNSSTT